MADCQLYPSRQALALKLEAVQAQLTMLGQQSALYCEFCKLKENFLKNRRRKAQKKGVKFHSRSWRNNQRLMRNHVVLDNKHWKNYVLLRQQENILTRCLACSDDASNYEYKFAFASYTEMVRTDRIGYFDCIEQYFDFHSLKYSALSKDTTNGEFEGCLKVLEDIVKLCEAMTFLRKNPSVEAVYNLQKCTDILLSWAKIQSWRNGCSTSVMHMLHSALYICPSWKIIDALKRWCKGMRIVSIGSGPGVVEKCMQALGWSVDAVEPHDYKAKSLLVTHKQYCQDYKFPTSDPTVLCIFYPGKESFDNVMEKGRCNYLKSVRNFLCKGHERVIVIHGDPANKFMKAEDKDPETLCCGTPALFEFFAGPWWTSNKQSEDPRVTFSVSSFMPGFPKFMTIFDLDERKRLDALEYLHNEGYTVEKESFIAPAISKIDCLQHQLEQQIEQGRNHLRPLRIEAQAAYLFIEMLEEHIETLQGPDSDTIRDSIRRGYDGHIQKISEKARICDQELYSIEQVFICENNKMLDQMSHVLKEYLDVNPDIASSDVYSIDIASSVVSPLGIVPSVVYPLDVSSVVSPLDVSSVVYPLDVSSDVSPLDVPPVVSPLDVSSDVYSIDIFRLNHRKKRLFLLLKDHHETKNDPETIRNDWVGYVQEDIDEKMQELQTLAEEFVVLNLTI